MWDSWPSSAFGWGSHSFCHRFGWLTDPGTCCTLHHVTTTQTMTIAASLAAATAITVALASTAGATTLDELHDSGCVPITWPQTGPNTVRYGGAGRQACAGKTATIVYDRADGTLRTSTFDLGAGTYTVDPALLCGRTQVDLFTDNVTGEANAPGFNPAHRLITVNWFDGPDCAPPVAITFATTPAPSPVESPLVTAPAPTVPLSSTATVTLDSPPSTVASPPPVDGGGPPPEPVAVPVPVGDILPVTGGRGLGAAILGGWVVLGGVLVVGLSWLRRRADRFRG